MYNSDTAGCISWLHFPIALLCQQLNMTTWYVTCIVSGVLAKNSKVEASKQVTDDLLF